MKQKPPPQTEASTTLSYSIISPLASSSKSPTKKLPLSIASLAMTVEKRKPARLIKRRHSLVNAQHATAYNMRKSKIEDQEFLQAAALWKIERQIPIVGQVNKQLGTSVQEQTVRRRVNSELDKYPPCLGCGCKSSVLSGI